MKKGFTFKQRMLLLILVCVLLLGIVYFVCSLTLVKSIKSAKSERRSLREQYQAVEVYVLQKDYYASEFENNIKESKKIIDNYVSDVTDKSLLYDFDRVLENYEMRTSALTLNDNIYVDEVMLEDKTYNLQTNEVSTSFDIELKNLKKFIKDIREKDLNLAIQTLAIAPDESTGLITGTITMNQNSIRDVEAEVEDPQYDWSTGIEELFD